LYVCADALPDGVPPLLLGGGQEFGQRAGTLAVPQIVGFGAAAALTRRRWREDAVHLDNLAAELWRYMRHDLGDDVQLNGSPEQRLPGCLNFSIAAVEGGALLAATPGVALSTGSACSSRERGSHVLRAMGLGAARERSAVRVSIGRYNTADEVAEAGATLVAAARRLQPTASGRLAA
jgi:cysteine desulfurase